MYSPSLNIRQAGILGSFFFAFLLHVLCFSFGCVDGLLGRTPGRRRGSKREVKEVREMRRQLAVLDKGGAIYGILSSVIDIFADEQKSN